MGFGLIACNTIAQGDTREVALDLLLSASFIVNRAQSSQKWPGLASLEISIVWVRKGGWNGIYVLDDTPTSGITAYLTPPNAVTRNPYRLKVNECKSFQGCVVLGMGFVLQPDESQALIVKDKHNKDVLFPYLNGEDLNTQPDQSPTRWVINFFDWPIERAMEYPDCFRIVKDKVQPDRAKSKRKVYRERWWQFAEKQPALQASLSGLKRAIVLSLVTHHVGFAMVPTNQVFAHRLAVFPLDNWHYFSVLQSNLHEPWARLYSSSLESRLNYSPTDCCETYPFPASLGGLESIGERYHAYRQKIMLARQEGLTKTYNNFHDPDETNADIKKLRELHVEMDKAAAAAYGWSDLDLDHGFHETKQGTRFTISESARREVLQRLLKLNHERHEQEEQSEPVKKKSVAPKRKERGKSAGSQKSIFDKGDGE